MSANPPTGAKKSGHPAWFFVVVGIGCLALWIVALLAQIETNEAYVMNGGLVNVFRPEWSILLQIPNLLLGNLSAEEGAAAFVGWAIELVYLALVVAGFEMLYHAASRSGQLMGKIFILLAVGLVIFNGWTDYHFGTFGTGDGGHWMFALVMSGVVGFLGTVGIYLIEHGWKRA